jgi:hypothetical protein
VAPPDKSAIEGVAAGTVQVCQSTPSQGFGPLDYAAIQSIDVPSGQMDGAFRKGEGDYIHQQGPVPQQLEHDRLGHVVASVGQPRGADRDDRLLPPQE